MARELGKDNIRTAVLDPAFTRTEAGLDLIAEARSYGVTRGALKPQVRQNRPIFCSIGVTA